MWFRSCRTESALGHILQDFHAPLQRAHGGRVADAEMGVVVAGVILAFVLVRIVISLLPLILAAGFGFLAFKLF